MKKFHSDISIIGQQRSDTSRACGKEPSRPRAAARSGGWVGGNPPVPRRAQSQAGPARHPGPDALAFGCGFTYKKRMIEFMQKGGPLMWRILFCSIIAVAVFAERLTYYHRATIQVSEFLRGLSNLIQRRNFAEALHESAGTPGPVARVIHSAIIRHDAPRSELREIVQEAGQLEVPKLERFLGVLATLAFLAPLLGLLGTVAGMIDAFGTIASHGGYATVTELSSGVYKSLLTTAAGLVVATPTFVAYSYLSARVNTMLHEMERAGIEIVHMLTESRPLSGIISFQQPAETTAADREAGLDR